LLNYIAKRIAIVDVSVKKISGYNHAVSFNCHY